MTLVSIIRRDSADFVDIIYNYGQQSTTADSNLLIINGKTNMARILLYNRVERNLRRKVR